MIKVVAVIDNIHEDFVVLKRLFDNPDLVEEKIIYIPIFQEVTSSSYETYADDVFRQIEEALTAQGVSLEDADLRIAVDLFLNPEDKEDTIKVEDKTGLKLLKCFINKYYGSFGIVHSYIMSKITTGGGVYAHTEKELEKIRGGVVLLRKPITVVAGVHELIEVKYESYMYTDVLDESKYSRRAYRAFLRALIYGERK